jgi:GNAT superfamily N-acetyltransferase
MEHQVETLKSEKRAWCNRPLNEAVAVRELFTEDQETRLAFGGPPYTEDLLTELRNQRSLEKGDLDMDRKRIRLGRALYVAKKGVQRAGPLAYIGVTLVSRARPLPYECTYVWQNRAPEYVDGVFVRRLVVKKSARGNGYGALLVEEAKALARKEGERLYLDTKADNQSMRRLAQKCGGAPNMFWRTPSGVLMVRYIWI